MQRSLQTCLMSVGFVLVTAGACAATAELLVQPSTLHTSCGRLVPRGEQSFEVEDACFRAVGPESEALRLDFTYLGPSPKAEPLASGEQRRQVGLKLHAQDTCNVVYVMWHIAPDSRIEVSVKHNPGKSEHAQCRDGGYTFVRADSERALPKVEAGTKHVLEAKLEGAVLSVRADGRQAWRGQLSTAALELKGPGGLRSDNVHLLMQLRAQR
jgi:hypothetical protein